jgi:molybdenum cofactor biosynthesis protein B
MTPSKAFLPLSLCVMTVSDSRTLANDTSGDYLIDALQAEGHVLYARALLPDDKYQLRAQASAWIADGDVDGILVTGGTGFTGRDSTPEALLPLLDKQMTGFGEVFNPAHLPGWQMPHSCSPCQAPPRPAAQPGKRSSARSWTRAPCLATS